MNAPLPKKHIKSPMELIDHWMTERTHLVILEKTDVDRLAGYIQMVWDQGARAQAANTQSWADEHGNTHTRFKKTDFDVTIINQQTPSSEEKKEHMIIHCAECGKIPADIEDLKALAEDCGMTPDDFVIDQEGTYNPKNGLFLCDDCYIAVGMPSLPYPSKWKVPDDYKSRSLNT